LTCIVTEHWEVTYFPEARVRKARHVDDVVEHSPVGVLGLAGRVFNGKKGREDAQEIGVSEGLEFLACGLADEINCCISEVHDYVSRSCAIAADDERPALYVKLFDNVSPFEKCRGQDLS
jgi:hypothetical protein